jgi:hypothetical protein
MVSAGKQRKLWNSLSELRSSVCERRLERTVLRPALLPVRTKLFRQMNWECRRRLMLFSTDLVVRAVQYDCESVNQLDQCFSNWGPQRCVRCYEGRKRVMVEEFYWRS